MPDVPRPPNIYTPVLCPSMKKRCDGPVHFSIAIGSCHKPLDPSLDTAPDVSPNGVMFTLLKNEPGLIGSIALRWSCTCYRTDL